MTDESFSYPEPVQLGWSHKAVHQSFAQNWIMPLFVSGRIFKPYRASNCKLRRSLTKLSVFKVNVNSTFKEQPGDVLQCFERPIVSLDSLFTQLSQAEFASSPAVETIARPIVKAKENIELIDFKSSYCPNWNRFTIDVSLFRKDISLSDNWKRKVFGFLAANINNFGNGTKM